MHDPDCSSSDVLALLHAVTSFVRFPGRRLWITMRGSSSGSTSYVIRATPAVQLSLVLSMSVEDFYGSNIVNNIATLLQVLNPIAPSNE